MPPTILAPADEEPPPKRHWYQEGAVDWGGLVMLVLSLAVGVTMIGSILVAIFGDHDTTDRNLVLLVVPQSVVLGALASFVGSWWHHHRPSS